jgi:hypothetical protein
MKVGLDHCAWSGRAARVTFEFSDGRLNQMKAFNDQLILKVERHRDSILEKRKRCQRLQQHFDELIAPNRIQNFGNNVHLVIEPRRRVQFEPRPVFSQDQINRIVLSQKLNSLLQQAKLEKEIWMRYVDLVSGRGQLETWNRELEKFL